MLDVALKEWQAVCSALTTGRQCILLRKGGIHEIEGKFELERSKFLLFPTYVHQNIEWIKPVDRSLAVRSDVEPETVQIPGWADVAEIWRVGRRESIDRLAAEHIYLPPLIDMRFDYKPHNPLYLMLLRAYRFTDPPTIANTPAYTGCRSWVPLDASIDIAPASAVMSEDQFELHRAAIASAF